LCRSCSVNKCRSLSTKESRVAIECPSCDGHGCSECNGGHFEIDGCPNSFCSSVVDSLDVFDLWEKGVPPIAGGTLDQSVSFIRAARFFDSEERRVRNARVGSDTN
jgi:hypothetical protein